MAFIVTNIFLIYHITRDLFYGDELQLISDEYIAYVENFLEEDGITLDGKIPREIYTLPALMVKYENYDHVETAKLFLGENYETISDNIYHKDQEQLEIVSNKRIKYTNLTKEVVDYRIDDERAIELSADFLKKRNLLRSDIVLKQVYLGTEKAYGEAPVYKLVYHQTYKGKFLGESYIYVYVNHKGVIGLEAMLLKENKTQSPKKRTIPATEALLRKKGDIVKDNKGDVIITDMEIGYYFNPYDSKYASWQLTESGTAIPTWKITLHNGKIYYVDALKY